MNFTSIGAGAGIIVNGNLVRGKSNYAGEIGFMRIDNSYVNNLLVKGLDDNKYIHLIATIIDTITCLIDPEFIALGGDTFRYDLIKDIESEIKKNNSNIDVELIAVKDSHEFGLKGIKKLTLDFINEETKLVEKNGRV